MACHVRENIGKLPCALHHCNVQTWHAMSLHLPSKFLVFLTKDRKSIAIKN
ncbi:MAG: hypothetical protein HDS84_08255 [Bacteroidales bacterium]|nr:hypothetical protein [Bacteroidales bacterium]